MTRVSSFTMAAAIVLSAADPGLFMSTEEKMGAIRHKLREDRKPSGKDRSKAKAARKQRHKSK